MAKVNSKPETAVEKINRLELTLHRELQRQSQEIDTLQTLVQSVAEAFQATLAVMKDDQPELQDKLKAKVYAMAVERAKIDMEKKEKAVAAAVEKKMYIPVNTVEEDCLLAVSEFMPDGSRKPPGKAFVNFSNLTKPAQEALRGKPVLYSVDIEGTTLEVLEVYKPIASTETEDRPAAK